MFTLRTSLSIITAVTALIFLFSTAVPAGESILPPPATEIIPVFDTVHGVVIEDPYRWLEDQESPETRTWIKAQNEYTQSFCCQFPNQEKVKARLGEMMRIDDISMPYECEGKYFFLKRAADQEQYVITVRDGLDGEDRVLVDPSSLDAGQNTSVDIFEISRDASLLAYGIRRGGEDETEIHFLNVISGEELKDVLVKGLYYSISIDLGNEGAYYSLQDSTGGTIYYHRFGDDFASDKVIFGGNYTASEICYGGLTEDRRYLVMGVYYGSTGLQNDVFLKDVLNDGPLVTLAEGIPAFFYPSVIDGRIYLFTNWEAPNWRVMAGDVENPGLENFEDLIAEDESAVIQQIAPIGGSLYLLYLEDVTSRVKMYDTDGNFIKDVQLPSLGTISALLGDWDGSEMFIGFSSFHIPNTVYRLDLEADKLEIFESPNFAYDSDNIEVKQVWYASKDGTQIPMFLTYRKGIALDGSNPTMLTGYGGFNVSRTPEFRNSYGYWVEAGGILAVPALRGGGEFGEEWHKAAMLEKKQNTFDDFIAAAEWLIENKYTTCEKLCIRGGSNGGLLVGAFMNQRPELCKAVICTYPLLDMVRFHKFLSGPFWVGEYGSADNPEHFDFIYKYSPYHNVEKGVQYPAVLYVTGDGDTRVAPLHARKMTALMQAVNGTENPVLLHYDTEAGHSAGTSVSKDLEEIAFQIGFLFWQLGVTP